MPLYEYLCDACGHRFEKIQKFSDPLIDTCPVCGGHVHKLMSSPAIQFKGSGFYITDYAKKDYTAATKADRDTGKDSKESKDSKETKDTKESKESTESKTEKTTEKSTTPSSSTSDSSATSKPAAASGTAKKE
jgi:putative FmdB family regulatory protein